MIETLIDKQDNFEIVLAQIGAILLTEQQNQQALAVLAGKDPTLWALAVFIDADKPWEFGVNPDGSTEDPTPKVNIWFDNDSFPENTGNVIDRQKSQATYNIDVYAAATTEDDGGTGQIPGDRAAAQAMHRALRLVRNILMAAEYTYLGLQGTVWKRWTRSRTEYQPQDGSQTVEHVIAGRLAFSVEFNEYSPQVEPETLQTVFASVHRASDGKLLFEAEYSTP